ncbi:hypothetical protein GCM10009760_52600 [Kitasatospora kazusensis]|uniref:Uncharacterized protein n=1 Tax=Kitasatospora kazusensis TaxID=407974 RepID=A0ABN3A561_9ACTN
MRINVRPAMGPVATIRGRDLRVVIDALGTHVRGGGGLHRRASVLLGELREVEHRIPVQLCGCGAEHHPADCPDAARRRGAGADAP